MSVYEALDVAGLPAIVSGPIVRRLTRTRVSVWVALSSGDEVTLEVSDGTQVVAWSAATTPKRAGTRLYLTVLTAELAAGFEPGRVYEYFILRGTHLDGNTDWTRLVGGDAWWRQLAAAGAAHPSFVGLPRDLGSLRIAHASCRKLHGGRRDALALAAELLDGAERPHLLLLTGDQIYADDVPNVLFPRLRQIASDVVGIVEPDLQGDALVGIQVPDWNGNQVGGRQALCNHLGFTSTEASNHVLSLSEFYALYLLQWSNALWPASFPEPSQTAVLDGKSEVYHYRPGAHDLNDEEQAITARWDDERAAVQQFRDALPQVARLLANVPTLMAPDDHEVTDDWNLDYDWAWQVYGDHAEPRASRVVLNALLAYLSFQHWGNVPDRFADATSPEARALDAAVFTGAHPEPTGGVRNDLRGWLGVPALGALLENAADSDRFPGGAAVLLRPASGGIRYDFQLVLEALRIVVLDERTQRRFDGERLPAWRVDREALVAMWPDPASDPAIDTALPTLVVAPAPVLGLRLVEHELQPMLTLAPGGAAAYDYESWGACVPAFEHLLALMSLYRRVIVLSGDVHFGYTQRLEYRRDGATSHAAQFTCSAAKNSDRLTLLLHQLSDFTEQLQLIRSRTFDGWNQALSLGDPPAGALPYDDVVDVGLGRVVRESARAPTVLSRELATAYGTLPAKAWSYTIDPIDADAMPAVAASQPVSTNRPAWVRSSFPTVKVLRESDLPRIGRVVAGVPQVGLLTFTTGATLSVAQRLLLASGDGAASVAVTTRVELG
jgi:hypothetical protein